MTKIAVDPGFPSTRITIDLTDHTVTETIEAVTAIARGTRAGEVHVQALGIGGAVADGAWRKLQGAAVVISHYDGKDGL